MIQETTLKYYDMLNQDEHHRYKSWEHNYLFFKENHKQMDDENIKDHASLHLAFYLASWGMLRGGSFLLQKDYKIHTYFIESVVANPRYWVFYMDEEIEKEEYISLVEELIQETASVYRNAVTEINGEKKSVQITDTLVTKILLGVYGNVPAYDRYFKAAVKSHGIIASLGKNSLIQLFDFYKKYEREFIQVKDEISEEVIYPPMKLVDMYFFNSGLQMDKSQQEGAFTEEDILPQEMMEVKNTNSDDALKRISVSGKGTIVQSVRDFILEKLALEKTTGAEYIDLKSGDIHRQMKFDSRMPIVCRAMMSIPSYKIEVIHETPSKYSSTNVVRYYLNS